MKPKILLRIASIIMFFHDVGHTFGHLTWKNATESAQQDVIRKMTDNKFLFMGTARSMGEYYDGYGFAATLAILFIAVILWLCSEVNKQTKQLVKNVLVATIGVLFFWCVDELLFFFPFAAAFSFFALVFTLRALYSLKRVE